MLGYFSDEVSRDDFSGLQIPTGMKALPELSLGGFHSFG